MTEIFNANEVKTKMSTLEGHFETFATTLKDINTTVNELVNNGPESAIFGEVGRSLLNTWNYNASTFGDFHTNFQNWQEVVSVIAANNAQFIVTAESIYRSNGANLAGVQEKKAAFAANPTASEYYQNLSTKTAEEEAADFIKIYGAIGNGTMGWLRANESLSPEAQAIVSAEAQKIQQEADDFINNFGATPQESAGWQEAYGKLSPEARKIVSDEAKKLNQNGEPQEPTTPEQGSPNATDSVTVVSGQEVTLNGEKCYFLMRDSSGNNYYVKSMDASAQVFVADEYGNLTPYQNYSNNKIISRQDFVNDRKNNLEYQWSIQYNNGLSPYDSVGTTVDSSFTANVAHPDQGLVSFSQDYLQNNATTLDSFDRGTYGLNADAKLPEVLYLAPGQSIKYDKPWDTYDNTIAGGSSGTYMVYDSSKDAYFVVNNGSYKTSSDGTFGLWISREQLFNERTTLKK